MLWRDHLGNNKSTRQWFAFIVTATTIELLLAIILLVNTIRPCFNRKIHAFLIALLLMLEFAIAVVIATLTSQLSILRDALSDRGRTPPPTQSTPTSTTAPGAWELPTQSSPSS